MRFKNGDIQIITSQDVQGSFIKDAIELYKCFNKQFFLNPEKDIAIIYKNAIDVLYQAFDQKSPIVWYRSNSSINSTFTQNNKVLICFSGGLDSVYQALKLREQGYEVVLLHVANMNKYTNGQELKATKNFAQDFNFDLEIVEMKASGKSKYWYENPFKNTLLYSIAFEYMQVLGIKNLSCGDDLRLPLVECEKAYNIADTKELTLAFINELIRNYNIDFIPVDDRVEKAGRLKYLRQVCSPVTNTLAVDYYYSCVAGGRFNASLHSRNEAKFGIKLEKYNCGSCRKCCIHSIMDHYVNGLQYSDSYLNHCWDKVAVGSDAIYFGKHLTIEQKLANFAKY